MKRLNRIVPIVSLMVLVVVLAAPAMATEAPDDSSEPTTTMAVPVQISEDQPAVVAPPIEEGEVEQPWTARFIYPLIVVGTFVLILGLAIGYNRSIRRRYQVVG